MADNNRNKSQYSSDENWGQNRQGNYGNSGDYGNVNDDRNSDRDRDWENQSQRSRRNYGSTGYEDSGSNYGDVNYGRRDEGHGSWGRQENKAGYGARGYGSSYDASDRRNENWRSGFGEQGSYSSDYGYQGQGSGYGSGGSGTSGGYDPGYNRQFGQGNTGAGGYTGRDYGNENYGNMSGNRTRNMYGGDTSNYGNANQGGFDRGWWDRTRDEVSSWFGDDDAERRRRMDKGNTGGGFRGKGPKDYHRSEDRIREDVCDRLTDDDRLDATDIQVQVKGDEVVLTGTVDSREQKRRAEDIVESISGVHNVENRIRVGRSHDSGSSDRIRTSGTDTGVNEKSKNK